MLPADETNVLLDGNDEIEEEILPDRTWKLDEDRCVIGNVIDGTDAVRQSLMCILRTERMEWEIYSEDYGSDLTDLIGENIPLVYVDIEDAVRDALIQDDRVDSVDDFNFEMTGKNSVHVTFTVTTRQGEISMEDEVSIGG